MAKNHFTGVTLGLSGGIDSALVAAMAADACGGENVWGISMPPCTPPTVPKTTPPIWPPTLAPITRSSPLSHCSTPTNSNLTLMRLRREPAGPHPRCDRDGQLQFARSARRGHRQQVRARLRLLDHLRRCGSGYAPIKDLLKTRVWEISRWRNKAAAAGVGIGGLKIVGNEDGRTPASR